MKGKTLRLNRVCYSCGTTKSTLDKRGFEKWNPNKDLDNRYLCHICFMHFIANPKRNGKGTKFLKFKNKYIKFSKNPRSGICSWCNKNIKKGTIKRTNLHHWFYLVIMPWACTIELCNSCHGKESWKLSGYKPRSIPHRDCRGRFIANDCGLL